MIIFEEHFCSDIVYPFSKRTSSVWHRKKNNGLPFVWKLFPRPLCIPGEWPRKLKHLMILSFIWRTFACLLISSSFDIVIISFIKTISSVMPQLCRGASEFQSRWSVDVLEGQNHTTTERVISLWHHVTPLTLWWPCKSAGVILLKYPLSCSNNFFRLTKLL